MKDQRGNGDSLHERVIDMVAQIGEWSSFGAKKSYAVEPSSPYVIDVVWIDSDEIAMAVEVHDGGNETEAKDTLRHEFRFGSRKVVIDSVPNAIARLRSICHFAADLKNWLEIWSVSGGFTICSVVVARSLKISTRSESGSARTILYSTSDLLKNLAIVRKAEVLSKAARLFSCMPN